MIAWSLAAAVALVIIHLGGLARAQEAAPSPAPTLGQPQFPDGAEQVAVDVVVADSQGQPVADLTASDFALTEDGAPREILAFEAVAPDANAGASRRDRVFAIVFDDIHLTVAAGDRARDGLRDLIATVLRDSDDVVLLMRTSTGQTWSGRAGSDRASLLLALEKMRGLDRQTRSCEMSDEEAMQIASLRNFLVQNAVYERYVKCGVLLPARLLNPPAGEESAAGLVRPTTGRPGEDLVETWAREQYQRSLLGIDATYAALERLLRALTPMRGRKSVILASEGFVSNRSLSEVEGVLGAAGEANAVVYFLDMRGLTPRALTATADEPPAPDASQLGRLHQERLLEAVATERLAEETGGTVISGHDPGKGLRRLAEDSRSHYLLWYSPRDPTPDGKLRTIHVDVKRPRLSVRARSGYYAVPRTGPPQPAAALTTPAVRAAPTSPAGASTPYDGDPAEARARVAGWSKEQADRAVAALKASSAADDVVEAAALAHAAAASSGGDPLEHQARAAKNAAALVRDPVRRNALERRILLGLAHRFLDARQWEVAQDLAQEATFRLPGDADALLALGIVQETTGSVVDGGRRPLADQSRLAAGYDELVSRNPVMGFGSGVPGARGRPPDTQQRMGSANGPTAETRLRSAAQSYRRALEARPDLAEAQLRLGRTLALLGEVKPAANELEAVAGGAEPSLAYLARLFLGDLKEQQNDFAGAAREYGAALAARGGSPVACLALARAAESRGDRAAAQAALESLLLEPADDAGGDPWWAYRLRPLGRWADALAQAP